MAAQYVADIGRRIRERRDELGMTQEDVARELPGKISGNQVSRWERGAHRPGDAQLESLARVLKVQVPYFFSDGPSNSAEAGPGKSPVLRALDEPQLDRIEHKLDAILSHLGLSDPAELLEQELAEGARTARERDAGTARAGRARQRANR